jgi:hypothetical protein
MCANPHDLCMSQTLLESGSRKRGVASGSRRVVREGIGRKAALLHSCVYVYVCVSVCGYSVCALHILSCFPVRGAVLASGSRRAARREARKQQLPCLPMQVPACHSPPPQVRVYAYVYVRTCVCVCAYVCMRMCMCMRMCVCVCVRVYAYVCMCVYVPQV